MKKLFLIVLYTFIIQILLLSSAISQNNQLPLTSTNCDSTPQLNKQILDFVNSKIKKKVGKGECWDLAAQALNTTNATWDKRYQFGNEVNYKTDCIFPGDIVQFEGIILKYEKDGKKCVEKMTHHTAIIYTVQGVGEFVLAHQNTAYSGKKVGTSSFDVKHIFKGKFKIYQPKN